MQPGLVLLATEAAASGGGQFVKGLAVFIGFMVFFVGSTWLLTSMILGARLGYLVTGASLFSVFTILAAIWFVTALGPKGSQGFLGTLGEETAWQPVATGPELASIDSNYGTIDYSGFPDGEGWVEPGDQELADLKEGDSLQDELDNAKPVMEALVGEAVNEIPGIRESVKDMVTGELALTPGNFATTDFKMKEANVRGKDSIIVAGRAVPKAAMNADLGGAAEGEVTTFLKEPGDPVKAGDPMMDVKAGDQTVQLKADKDGTLLSYGFKEGDSVKPGAPFATVDITGQPGAPAPAEVAAARVRGSVRVPSFIYLAVSLLLLGLHLVGLKRYERTNTVAEPQLA